MAAREKSPFSAEQIAEFNRIQALRPVALRWLADTLEVWRYCGDAVCKRARSCRRSDGASVTAFMQALPDEERQMFRYAVENRRNGVAPDEAFERAQARVEREMRAFGELGL